MVAPKFAFSSTSPYIGESKTYSNSLEISDPTKSNIGFELPANYIEKLQQRPIKGIGKIVQPNDIMPGSKKTWQKAFEVRFNRKINRENGVPVPLGGLKSKPKIQW
ncbi:MAG: hypothetical protein ABIU63_17745 [Chitinophagaceae bacterium]